MQSSMLNIIIESLNHNYALSELETENSLIKHNYAGK